MAGLEVSRPLLDMRAAEAVLAIREAFRKVETVAEYLATVPANAADGDPLKLPTQSDDPNAVLGKFGYNDDEAYLLRYVFEQLQALNVQPILDAGRKLTGLE